MNHRSRTLVRHWGALALMSTLISGVGLSGCVAAIGTDLEGEGDASEANLGESEQSIQNGETDFSGLEWMQIRTARVRTTYANNHLGTCSGTVLDPRTVLTARHCVTTVEHSFTGSIVAANKVLVRIYGSTYRIAARIVPMEASGSEKHDVALVFLAEGDELNDAEGDPIFTPMEPNDPESYDEDTVRISGYGEDTGSDTYLRHGKMVVDDDYVTELLPGSPRKDGIILRTNAEDQRGLGGDSGGPYWGDTRDSGTLPRGIIGVHSSDSTGGNTEAGTQVFRIRDWARDEISKDHGLEAGVGRTLTFNSSSDFDDASRYSPEGDSGTWEFVDGRLVQQDNVVRTYVVWEHHVTRDFDASVSIDSPDNDGAGILFHFANPHYYYCEADDEENVLRIRSRVNGTFTTLASKTWSGTFASAKTMTVTGRDTTYTCKFDGVTVTATEVERLPVGSLGLIQDFNDGVRFNNFAFTGG